MQGMQCMLASRRCTHSARTRLRLDGGFKFVLAQGETAAQVCVAAALGVQLSPALIELVPQLLRAIDRVVAVSEQPGIFLPQGLVVGPQLHKLWTAGVAHLPAAQEQGQTT